MFILIAISGQTFAHDCSLVDGSENNNFAIADTLASYKAFMPAEAIKTALIHLKAYCCSQIIPDNTICIQDKKILPATYPESEFLFDQLLDVSMRRLDGATTLAYNLEVDSTALNWRKIIARIVAQPAGQQGNEINTQFATYFTKHELTSQDLLQNYNDIDRVSLQDKYDWTCQLIKSLYTDLKRSNLTVIDDATMTKCWKIVSSRVSREKNYVQVLMTKKSNQLLNETTTAYTKKYFVEEKLAALSKLITQVKDLRQSIVKQAPASKKCSK